jgi:hypothetical protein
VDGEVGGGGGDSQTDVMMIPHTPWHYSPEGHKPPLIRFHSLI